jgi:hypothetical protein
MVTNEQEIRHDMKVQARVQAQIQAQFQFQDLDQIQVQDHVRRRTGRS